ncbi:ArgS-related anticodon-binding protein NrtL [Streptomyces sp. SS]|uniref:ArgS-related anticodon-binding protein NrtL n=1 Tax=Streptomyces sp. SS TaxID=260742 RepID=UPI0002EF0F6B|nr:DALR anticodon-binding domain-containing protein [Streptomyces sp. SS]
MTPAELSLTVLHAVRRAVDDGVLRVEVPSRVKVERARPGGAGEYASNVALTLARPAGRSALEVAGIIGERLRDVPGLDGVEITGPGFLNFTLQSDAGREVVRAVADAGVAYGHGTALAGTEVRFAEVAEERAEIVVETVVRLLRSQGARAAVDGWDDESSYAGSGARETSSHPAPHSRVHVHPASHPAPPSRVHVHPAPHSPIHPHPTPRERVHVRPDRLGVDAARWGLLRAAPGDRALEGEGLLVQHERNGLFRVRYAYSRVRRLVVNGEQLGVTPVYETPVEAAELIGALGDHPVVLLAAARHRAPDRVARHLEAVADALLAFQHTVLPLGDEKPSAAHRSRLALAEAAGTVLAGGLSVLGISAPDRI